jgi:hypothetical protein
MNAARQRPCCALLWGKSCVVCVPGTALRVAGTCQFPPPRLPPVMSFNGLEGNSDPLLTWRCQEAGWS